MRKGRNWRTASIASAVALVVSLGGCAGAEKKDIGTLFGAALGAWAGHEIDDGGTAGVLIGAAAGALIGRMIGQYMDESDKEQLAETIDHAPTGQPVRWTNPDSGNAFSVTPTSNHYAQGNQQCRTFNQVVEVDGRIETMPGVACRAPGSDELIVEELPV